MKLPFKNKQVKINNSEKNCLKNYSLTMEIPMLPHPGAFGKIRKNHIHEGIDLYCEENEPVYAMESGLVVSITSFTGEIAGSPWWNDTWSIMIEGYSGVINYGEIEVDKEINIGQEIREGQLIGKVLRVLKSDKGRPLSMLHLELYEKGVLMPVLGWELNCQKPAGLKNPIELLEYSIAQIK